MRLRKHRQSPSDEIRARSLGRIDATIARADGFRKEMDDLEAECTAPLTWQEFWRQWTEACTTALTRDYQLDVTCTLPDNVFPRITQIANPATGQLVTITRISPFAWENHR